MIGEYTLDDEVVAAYRATGRAAVAVYRVPRVMVVLGRGSRAEVELIEEAIARDGVPVLRRRGGGCAVVLDEGNLVVAVAAPLEGIGQNKWAFARLTAWLIEGLSACGVTGVTSDGVSDLVLGEGVSARKISGSCLHREKGFVHYAASLLVEADVGLMGRYLAHPPREPGYRAGRAHEAFVVNLSERFDVTVEGLRAGLEGVLSAAAVERVLGGDERRASGD